MGKKGNRGPLFVGNGAVYKTTMVEHLTEEWQHIKTYGSDTGAHQMADSINAGQHPNIKGFEWKAKVMNDWDLWVKLVPVKLKKVRKMASEEPLVSASLRDALPFVLKGNGEDPVTDSQAWYGARLMTIMYHGLFFRGQNQDGASQNLKVLYQIADRIGFDRWDEDADDFEKHLNEYFLNHFGYEI